MRCGTFHLLPTEKGTRGITLGADDCVTKPFGKSEILARVRTQLRRLPAEQPEAQVIDSGYFLIDLQARRVKVRGSDVHLTPKELELLIYLARKAGRVVPHRKLLTTIWGADSANQPEYLRVLVGQLQKRLKATAKKTTRTIIFGNRRAPEFIPAAGVTRWAERWCRPRSSPQAGR